NGNDEGKLAPHSADRTAHGLGPPYRRLGSLGHGLQLRHGGTAGSHQPGAHESNRRPAQPCLRPAGTTAVPQTTLPRLHRASVATGIAGCGSPRLERAAAALAPTATCQPATSPDVVRLMIDHRTAQNLEDFVHNCLESAARSR